ncbi:uncharacterized mitochondrial protein-like protein [Tanacetum coccineum]|uniref:Uncharacterized mitochondrial protein-like protein n=1 Tax=Tanacetum coccineum TaxID=301880 RepID=A0ABQ5HUE5_9ASTR
MKDLSLVRYFLGIEVASLPKGYLLSHFKYIGDLLDCARITDKMVEDIPIDAKAKFTPTDGDPLPDPSLYLRGTKFQTLLFPSTSALDLRAYCDSDWAGDVVSRKSTISSGIITTLRLSARLLTPTETSIGLTVPRISGFPNEAEDCEALVIEGQIAREASKIRDILDNTTQNTTHGKGKRQASSQQLNTYS